MKTFATYKTESAHTKCVVCSVRERLSTLLAQQKSKTHTENCYSLETYNSVNGSFEIVLINFISFLYYVGASLSALINSWYIKGHIKNTD